MVVQTHAGPITVMMMVMSWSPHTQSNRNVVPGFVICHTSEMVDRLTIPDNDNSKILLKNLVWCMMYDVWCMMYDVWCMMYDVWCMMYDVWCMMYDVWCMMCDVSSMQPRMKLIQYPDYREPFGKPQTSHRLTSIAYFINKAPLLLLRPLHSLNQAMDKMLQFTFSIKNMNRLINNNITICAIY